ncbi:hypothetical protein CONCODRAFT_35311 [Conidiobolus coronatus NRRL 28638]|uniref:Amine oxidase domain-containing protein n=1 Tax=Conidiobolus coronatus (strain ATCC 28846 / CBS 209.66 / NRRL 28638) TaxID=796925 RepID=A0A137PG14_CONC2|nr:hypothetical protein CONCODRAFT_35311 [Conidiobolus coronatus NRRL 28638]|eukprot:KXN73881.1 hypothetical protein CONCODRAFT_35311 [Conidiobolus coronatus NRRL 28638]
MKIIKLAYFALISADDIDSKSSSNKNIETEAASQANGKSPLPVCIIGAGLSGLRVADNLKKKGHSVKLFEKDDQVGGKANTFRKDGRVYNMGAAILSDYHVKTFEIIKKAKISFEIMQVKYDGAYDYNSGFHTAIPYLDKDPATLTAFENYRKIRPRLNIDTGYLNASTELFVTAEEWIKSNNLIGLTKFATIFLTMEGYGSLNTTPALYFIQLMDIIRDITKPLYQIPNGIDAIPLYIAKDKDITFNASITKIFRHDHFSAVSYTVNNKENTQFCSSVVLAFPPHSNDVSKLVSDFSKEEKLVLDEVKTTKYGSIASAVTNLPYTALSASLPPTNPPYLGDGIPMIFFNQTNGAFVSYHWIEGEYDIPPTEADASVFETKLKTLFSKLKPGSGSQPALLTKSWTYFPHVTVESLKNGFYKKFDSIQGKKGLYYATPLLAFELMETTFDSADYLVERFF